MVKHDPTHEITIPPKAFEPPAPILPRPPTPFPGQRPAHHAWLKEWEGRLKHKYRNYKSVKKSKKGKQRKVAQAAALSYEDKLCETLQNLQITDAPVKNEQCVAGATGTKDKMDET